MRPGQFMFLVEFGVVGGGVLGGEVCLQVGGDGREGAADNLLDRTGVQIYAGAETRHCGVVDERRRSKVRSGKCEALVGLPRDARTKA